MHGVRSGTKAAYAHGLTKYYLSYRFENRIFIFYDPIANDFDPIIDLIRKYCIAAKKRNIESYIEHVESTYSKDKEFFKATTLLQKFLIKKELYNGKPDGGFGYNTAEAFQVFLKQHGYYHGKIDRNYGKGTRDAIKKLQRFIKAEETGTINLETIEKTIKTFA